MSPFVVRSCEGDIVRSDGFVRRSSFVHAFVVVVVFIVAVAAVTEPSYLA